MWNVVATPTQHQMNEQTTKCEGQPAIVCLKGKGFPLQWCTSPLVAQHLRSLNELTIERGCVVCMSTLLEIVQCFWLVSKPILNVIMAASYLPARVFVLTCQPFSHPLSYLPGPKPVTWRQVPPPSWGP